MFLIYISSYTTVMGKNRMSFEDWKKYNVWLKRGNTYFLNYEGSCSYGDLIKKWKKATRQP